jgi:alpha-galactosidase
MSLWLYDPSELESISDQDREILNREIQHYIDTDPVVRAIMIVDRGVPDKENNDPIVRAIKYAQAGAKEYLKQQLKPLYERIKFGRQPGRP